MSKHTYKLVASLAVGDVIRFAGRDVTVTGKESTRHGYLISADGVSPFLATFGDAFEIVRTAPAS